MSETYDYGLRDEIAAFSSPYYLNVEESAWKQELPNLPDDVIAMLAPPVTVSVEAQTPARPTSVRRLGSAAARSLLAPTPAGQTANPRRTTKR